MFEKIVLIYILCFPSNRLFKFWICSPYRIQRKYWNFLCYGKIFLFYEEVVENYLKFNTVPNPLESLLRIRKFYSNSIMQIQKGVFLLNYFVFLKISYAVIYTKRSEYCFSRSLPLIIIPKKKKV